MRIKSFIRIILTLCVAFQCIERVLNVPVYGKFMGKTQKVLNKHVFVYLSIPYAAPPVGKLRFQASQPVQYENNIYNATQKPPSCMQDPPNIFLEWIDRSPKKLSEDCLYLNIWVPASSEDGKPFTTMVWIYGGGFHMGSSNMNIYDGAVMASIGNVIVVSFNYRVSTLGYSNFDTPEARGNMGMLDQVMALKWVHRNIKAFGGDNNLITIFGQSAGSISAAHHLISPMTKGLFRRAILQSGSNYLEYFVANSTFVTEATTLVSNEVGCNGSDVLNCMQEKDAYELVAAEKKLIKRKETFVFFRPQTGPPYLPEDPFYSIDTGKFHDVDVMIGDVKDEGSIFIIPFKPEVAISNIPIFPKSTAKYIMSKCFEITGENLNRIEKEYLGDIQEEDYSRILKETVRVIGNGAFTCPIFHLADKLSQYHRKVYHYRFNHTRIKFPFKKWIGVPHFEDVHFVFGRPFLKKKAFTPEEVEFSRNLIQLWTSFAKTGKPTYDGFKEEWKPFDKTNRNSLSLTLGNIRPVRAEVEEKCEFWKDFLRDYTRVYEYNL